MSAYLNLCIYFLAFWSFSGASFPFFWSNWGRCEPFWVSVDPFGPQFEQKEKNVKISQVWLWLCGAWQLRRRTHGNALASPDIDMSLYLQKSPVYLQKSAFACIFANESACLDISCVLVCAHHVCSPIAIRVSHSLLTHVCHVCHVSDVCHNVCRRALYIHKTQQKSKRASLQWSPVYPHKSPVYPQKKPHTSTTTPISISALATGR